MTDEKLKETPIDVLSDYIKVFLFACGLSGSWYMDYYLKLIATELGVGTLSTDEVAKRIARKVIKDGSASFYRVVRLTYSTTHILLAQVVLHIYNVFTRNPYMWMSFIRCLRVPCWEF